MSQEGFVGKVAGQVLVNVATAVTLFLIASAFQSEVQSLFDTLFRRKPPAVSYPVYCTYEPFDGDPVRREMKIDLYIVNLSGDSFSEADLRTRLAAVNPDSSRPLAPRIALAVGTPATATFLPGHSDAFNEGKGSLSVSVADDGRRIVIDIERIERRAVLKATFLVSNLDFVSPRLNRSNTVAFLDPDRLHDRCYSF